MTAFCVRAREKPALCSRERLLHFLDCLVPGMSSWTEGNVLQEVLASQPAPVCLSRSDGSFARVLNLVANELAALRLLDLKFGFDFAERQPS
jgi:hypothetical protein